MMPQIISPLIYILGCLSGFKSCEWLDWQYGLFFSLFKSCFICANLRYPSDSKIQIAYVTYYLAVNNMYDKILDICWKLHDKEKDLKESAFSFAADALSDNKFYESAKKLLYIGLEKYPSHLVRWFRVI